MKRHSSKQLKMEKMRFSILYKNLSICAECGIKNGSFDDRIGMFTHIDKNEVFEGSYRETSIKNGMIVPLCSYCHKKFHNNKNFNLKYKNLFENEFLKEKSIEEFISLFKKDYIYLYEKASKND